MHLKVRQYEALGTFHCEGCSRAEAAKRGGYSYKSFCNLLTRFRTNPTAEFFWPKRPKPEKQAQTPDPRSERIPALRKQHNALIYQIREILEEEGLRAGICYIQNIFTRHGIRRMPRRSADARSMRVIRGVRADRRSLALQPQTFQTDFGGLFALDLGRLRLADLLTQVGRGLEDPSNHQ